MSYKVTKENVWVAVIDDRPGALYEKLNALSAGGADLELIITRRERKDRALMFISPLRTPEAIQAAQKAGFSIADSLRNLRIAGPNAPGLGARITGALAQAGISMRGYSAASLGELSVTNITYDSDADQEAAIAALNAALGL